MWLYDFLGGGRGRRRGNLNFMQWTVKHVKEWKQWTVKHAKERKQRNGSGLLCVESVVVYIRLPYTFETLITAGNRVHPDLPTSLVGLLCFRPVVPFIQVPTGSPSRGGDAVVHVKDVHQPSLPASFFLFCSCVYFSLYIPFNCILFHKFSRQLSAFSLCSSGLNSGLLSFQLYTASLCESLHQPWYNQLWLTRLKAPTNELYIQTHLQDWSTVQTAGQCWLTHELWGVLHAALPASLDHYPSGRWWCTSRLTHNIRPQFKRPVMLFIQTYPQL